MCRTLNEGLRHKEGQLPSKFHLPPLRTLHARPLTGAGVQAATLDSKRRVPLPCTLRTLPPQRAPKRSMLPVMPESSLPTLMRSMRPGRVSWPKTPLLAGCLAVTAVRTPRTTCHTARVLAERLRLCRSAVPSQHVDLQQSGQNATVGMLTRRRLLLPLLMNSRYGYGAAVSQGCKKAPTTLRTTACRPQLLRTEPGPDLPRPLPRGAFQS